MRRMKTVIGCKVPCVAPATGHDGRSTLFYIVVQLPYLKSSIEMDVKIVKVNKIKITINKYTIIKNSDLNDFLNPFLIIL